MCGGRFAIVPAAACLDPDLGNGPHRLYVILCSHARPDGICKLSLKVLGRKLHLAARTIQAWKRSLEKQGWLEELHQGDKAIGTFRVIRDPAERKAALQALSDRNELASLRLFLGKSRDDVSQLALYDLEGNPRIRMMSACSQVRT